MSEFKADLHCHSTFSDGSKSPVELIDLAIDNQLSALAITDHDSIEGYFEGRDYAKDKGLFLVPGVEFSTEHKGVGVHILGLGVNPSADAIQILTKKHILRRQERMEKMLNKLQDLGLDIYLDEIYQESSQGVVGRVHLGTVLVNKGICKDLDQAFSEWIGSRGKGFVKQSCPGLKETLRVIHEAGGKALLAHPHLLQMKWVKKELLCFDFDGLEVFYSRFHRGVCESWLKIVESRNFCYSGGSDYHGDARKNLDLGRSWIGKDPFINLISGTFFEQEFEKIYGQSLQTIN